MISILIEHLLINCNNEDKELITQGFELLLGVSKSASQEI